LRARVRRRRRSGRRAVRLRGGLVRCGRRRSGDRDLEGGASFVRALVGERSAHLVGPRRRVSGERRSRQRGPARRNRAFHRTRSQPAAVPREPYLGPRRARRSFRCVGEGGREAGRRRTARWMHLHRRLDDSHLDRHAERSAGRPCSEKRREHDGGPDRIPPMRSKPHDGRNVRHNRFASPLKHSSNRRSRFAPLAGLPPRCLRLLGNGRDAQTHKREDRPDPDSSPLDGCPCRFAGPVRDRSLWVEPSDRFRWRSRRHIVRGPMPHRRHQVRPLVLKAVIRATPSRTVHLPFNLVTCPPYPRRC